MKIRKFLIAGGNSTALVYGCPVRKKGKIAKSLLKSVEQVGFISQKAKLQMMGNELCINATLAFASTLNKKGKIITSGIKKPVQYSNKQNTTTIRIPLKFRKKENIILFEGIGFVIFSKKEKLQIRKKELSGLCKKYRLPAFGVIIYNKNKITPFVYVKAIDSFLKETACGSGSVAFSIFSGKNKVIQPTGKTISVKRKRFVEVTAQVNEI